MKMETYAKMLLSWGAIHNLSGAKTLESINENIEDSIYPLNFIKPFRFCLDIGSGSGFPAIPLSIKLSESKFILCEPRLKRAAFLRAVVAKLELKNVTILTNRVEDIKLDSKVDLITSRAVMDTNKLIQLSNHLKDDNGYFLLYKGLDSSLNEAESIKFKRKNRVYLYFKEYK